MTTLTLSIFHRKMENRLKSVSKTVLRHLLSVYLVPGRPLGILKSTHRDGGTTKNILFFLELILCSINSDFMQIKVLKMG